ncbi:MAG: calcium/sodium antiporter [Phycisphaerae bacterium]
MIADLLKLVGGAILLVGGGELLVRGAAAMARSLGVSAMVIGLTVVAYGTSAPEFVVSVMASSRGNSAICGGNVVGSNILNILLVLGITAVIFPIQAKAAFVRREVPIMVGVSALFWLLAANGELTRLEGALLLVLLAGYTVLTVRLARREKKAVANSFEDLPQVKRRTIALNFVLVAIGLALLAGGSEWFLQGAVAIARRLNVSEGLIGLTLVAAGTSLPELAASLIAALRKHPDMCLGNLVGSSIYNILGIAGTAGVVAPLSFEPDMVWIHLPVMVAAAAVMWPMVYRGLMISRREGALLLTIYAGYVGCTVWRAAG